MIRSTMMQISLKLKDAVRKSIGRLDRANATLEKEAGDVVQNDSQVKAILQDNDSQVEAILQGNDIELKDKLKHWRPS